MISFMCTHDKFSLTSYSLSYIHSPTDVNDAVFELTDILLLKRRAVGCPPGGAAPKTSTAAAVGGTEPQEQQHQPGEEEEEPSSKQPSVKLSEEPPASRDVASAVISGRMHACETNHDLDNTENKKFSTMMLSSKSVSAITLGTKSRGDLTSSKSSSKKKRGSSSKYKRYRKGEPRVYRLLHANGIVPFIHLPARVKAKDNIQGTSSSGLKVEGVLVSSKKVGKRTNNGSDENCGVRGNKKARFESSSSSNSSGNEGGDASASRSKNSSSTSGNEGGDAVPAAAAGPRKNKSSSASVADALLALRSGP